MNFFKKPLYSPLLATQSKEGSGDKDDAQWTDSKEAIQHPSPRRSDAVGLCSVVASIALISGVAIGATLFRKAGMESGAQIESPVKQFAPRMPLKSMIFADFAPLMEPPNQASDEFWDSLLPYGGGFVNISNPQDYNLKPGIPTDTGVDRYGVSMYHSIHCLMAMRKEYWRKSDLTPTPRADARSPEPTQHMLPMDHTPHCLAYLLRSTLCSADTTIEWAEPGPDNGRLEINGRNIPHQCADPDAVKKWMWENHGPQHFGDPILPG